MKIKYIAFNGKSITSRLIKAFTRSNRSHIAYLHGHFVPIDGNDKELIEAWGKGLSWKYSSLSAHTPGTPYEVWELEVTEDEFNYVEQFFKHMALVETPYDYLANANFITRFKRGSKEGNMCSEGSSRAVKKIKNLTELNPEYVSPQNFIEIFQACGAVKTKEAAT